MKPDQKHVHKNKSLILSLEGFDRFLRSFFVSLGR